jgi:hypothetical protein
LVILNTSKKLEHLHDNIFEFKVHFESKLIMIQWLDEEDWIKSMYTKYITYSFSTSSKGCKLETFSTLENDGSFMTLCFNLFCWLQRGFCLNCSKTSKPFKTIGLFDNVCTLQQMFPLLNNNNRNIMH